MVRHQKRAESVGLDTQSCQKTINFDLSQFISHAPREKVAQDVEGLQLHGDIMLLGDGKDEPRNHNLKIQK